MTTWNKSGDSIMDDDDDVHYDDDDDYLSFVVDNIS